MIGAPMGFVGLLIVCISGHCDAKIVGQGGHPFKDRASCEGNMTRISHMMASLFKDDDVDRISCICIPYTDHYI